VELVKSTSMNLKVTAASAPHNTLDSCAKVRTIKKKTLLVPSQAKV